MMMSGSQKKSENPHEFNTTNWYIQAWENSKQRMKAKADADALKEAEDLAAAKLKNHTGN
jgi:hypothetical protein